MLSEADIRAMLVMIAAVDPRREPTEVSVPVWMEILKPVPDADVLKEGTARMMRAEKAWDWDPKRLLDHVDEVIAERNEAARERREQLREEALIRAALTKLGRTAEEFNGDDIVKQQARDYVRAHGWALEQDPVYRSPDLPALLQLTRPEDQEVDPNAWMN